MKQGFLEQESKRGNKRVWKKLFIELLIIICLVAFIGFAVKDTIDFSDEKTRKLLPYIYIVIGMIVLSVVFQIFHSIMILVNGKNLTLPFKENTKAAVGEIIDREVAEGKVLVEEYIYEFSEEEKPKGERVILLPSYLLICNGMGHVMAIPRDKIYWICAQTGIKGRSSFMVRLLIFTEKRTFYLNGVDIPQMGKIADKLYQYIPNVFSEYASFPLYYELEELFEKNRGAFLKLYEEKKKELLEKG